MKTALIEGPVGHIEIVTRPASGDIWAVLCHPHPQFGGSMYDLVIERMASAYAEHDVNCLLFNFRGVGASAGRHDHGAGEVDDLRAILAWLRDTHHPRETWLAGYSWGSHVAWKVASTDPGIKRLTLVAPVVDSLGYDGDVVAATQIVVGSADDFVSVESIEKWANGRYPVNVIEGADHFFAGSRETVTETISAAIKKSPLR
jgi:hypothetical protein